MITVFIVDNEFEYLYFYTADRFSEVLKYLNIEPERVTFRTIPFETLAMIWDNKVPYIMRNN